MKEKKVIILLLIFCVIVKFFLGLPLDNSLPGGTDTSSHLFKVWYIVNHGITKWNPYWYAGYPFLRYYPPLSYLIAGSIGKFVGYVFSYKLINNLFISITPLVFFIFLREFNLKKEEIIIALVFFSFVPIYAYYLADGRYPSLINLVFDLLFWTFLKKTIDNGKIKNIILASIFLGLGILTHHLTTLVLLPITFFWVISYDFHWKTFYKFFLISFISLLLTAWWVIPFSLESLYFKPQTSVFEVSTPISLKENLMNRLSGFAFFWLPLSKEVLILVGIITFILAILSLKDWNNKINRNFFIATISAIAILFLVSYKRTFVFLPIPVSILVARGALKLGRLTKFIIPIFFVLIFMSYLSVKPQSFVFPEFPNIPKEGRVLFLPLGDGFQESEKEVKSFYSVMLSPLHGNEHIYGWFIESQRIGKAGPKKLQYYNLMGQPLSMKQEEYYKLLKEGWVNYVTINKKEKDLINYFNSSNNFKIFNQTKNFVVFEIVPKSKYVEMNGKEIEANVLRKEDSVLIGTECDGAITVKESYHENWKVKVNGKNAKIEPNEFGFIKITPEKNEKCSVELKFKDPEYYSIFSLISLVTYLAILMFFIL
jgi:hypothetical protein